MEALTYKVEAYEGPLDVLLGLIRKNEVNICDIPIAELLRQFIEHIDVMRRENLEVSSEFLIMAANLVQIKSAMLLPKYDGDAEDPRTELVNLLLEYERYKSAAVKFREHESGALRFVREPAQLDIDRTYTGNHSQHELERAYGAVSASVVKKERKASPSEISKTVLRKSASITSRILLIIRLLAKKTKIVFIALVGKEDIRGDATAAFVAALELARAGRIHIDGGENSLTLSMTRSARQKMKHKI